jgi:L-fuconate dehydratase
VSASKEGSVIEYVPHLHEHFKTPVVIKNAHYMPPTVPGYSIDMKQESLCEYEFPYGPVWQQLKQGK